MEKWIVLQNCQTVGLANSLKLQFPGADIDAVDIWAYKSGMEKHDAKLDDYSRIIVHPEFLGIQGTALTQMPNLHLVPSVFFSAYHPDSCYAASSTGGVSSPIGAYNSMICLAAYRSGLSVDQALSMYNARTYELAGYFDVWSQDKKALLETFSKHGLKLADAFNRWGRYRPFMYSVNHPSIDVVYDLAHEVLISMKLSPIQHSLRPHDNLMNGACFAVYPEIAESCGVQGAPFFKFQGGYGTMPLDAFVRESYRMLEGLDPKSLVVDGMANSRFKKLLQIMEA